MPQDVLQISLEHHRAGRLRQAGEGYRALLDRNPDDADAAHWLGVLAVQAGRAGDAVPLLEKAAALRPDDAAHQHNLGQAYLACGRSSDAAGALRRAAELQPERRETWVALALAHLAPFFRRETERAGDADAAVDALRRATAAGADSADVHHHLGVALLAAARPDEAAEALRGALERKPDFASAWYHLALAHQAMGEEREVRKCLNKALELEPALPRAWHALATLDARAGNADVAAGLFRKAIKAKPDYAAAYLGLGKALDQAGRPEEASSAYRQALRASRGELSSRAAAGQEAPSLTTAVAETERKIGGPKALAFHSAMTTITNVFPPTHIAPASVEKLFDDYAERFDEHLRGRLEYRVPEMMAQAVSEVFAGRLTENAASGSDAVGPLDVLDLGCGTGLSGALLRPIAALLYGVDLSAAMLEKARERGVYDRLEQGELTEAMRRYPRGFDLLVATDVLIYTGDLNPVFQAAAACLRPGGVFVFSVEAGGGDRYHLDRETRRFAHSEAYLRRLASIHGFVDERFTPIAVRTERRRPLPGYLVVLRISQGEGTAHELTAHRSGYFDHSKPPPSS